MSGPPPAMMIPPGDPSFCDASGWATAALGVSITFFVIANIMIPLRLYTRIWVSRCFWWDDVALLIAYALFVPSAALLWNLIDLGLGKHLPCIPLDTVLVIGQRTYTLTAILTLSATFSRISVALFVIRLFAITTRLRVFLYMWTIFMFLSTVITTGLLYDECNPIAALWDPLLAPIATCWSTVAKDFLQYYNGAVGVASDLVLAFLPAYFLSRLQMRTKLKISLSIILGVGLFAAACGLARTVLSISFVATDPIYDTAKLSLWGNLEVEGLIVTTTAPALWPLFSKKGASRRDTSSNYYHHMLPSRVRDWAGRGRLYWSRMRYSSAASKASSAGRSNGYQLDSQNDTQDLAYLRGKPEGIQMQTSIVTTRGNLESV